MKVIAISGDGTGAGKTFLARKLAAYPHLVISLADCIRHDLTHYYPDYDWYNKSQDYKDKVIVAGTGKTVREMMLSYGAEKREQDPNYWVNSLICHINDLYDCEDMGQFTVTIDDIRYLNELEKLRSAFGPAVTHIHVVSSKANPEPFDNDTLREIADYTIRSSAHA